MFSSLECQSFMTDFEKAMRSALGKVYPNASLYTCWFHFTQAVKRHANKKIPRFANAIQNDKVSMEIYGKMMCLPLLPAQHINVTWANIRAEALAHDKRRFKRFAKYYEQQWIVNVREYFTFLFLFARFIHIFWYYRREQIKYRCMAAKHELQMLLKHITA